MLYLKEEDDKKIGDFERQIMGNRSFANFIVHPKLASSPDDANSFLLELNKIIRPKSDEAISYYFPLSQCIEGLKALVQSLFGATFYSITLVPGEAWHEDVLKMSLHHPEKIVALVCNFSAHFDSSTARLKHWEVETLLQEFGHVLHPLLSRTVMDVVAHTAF
ncbi:hypothetical protein GIB67_033475 [Kingdonia uniflora]|uniref:Peptidase M3A/M3B catalytic domain-containing protein n=1 Tax=Kingdonia uniflora TaxID=39325 RepID=A0A7J7MDQ8_9MAGN|nr:hypothetical protein GIB67_033475 [Kingdonia uniflora]